MNSEINNSILIVDENTPNSRLDFYISESDLGLSRSQVKKLLTSRSITVNGDQKPASYKPAAGDQIELDLSSLSPTEIKAYQQDIDVDVIFEDEHILIVNKPTGLVTHPGAGNLDGTLVNALYNRLYKNDSVRPGVVHRLDKDTSGLLVLAKTEKAFDHLSNQFKEKTARRLYWAICFGKLKNSSGKIETKLARSQKDRKRIASQKEGKVAITHFKVLKEGPLSLVELSLETGRTHQIRVHMSEMGHPVLNDVIYSSPKKINDIQDAQYKAKIKRLKRMCLVAKKLTFTHPVSLEELNFEIDWPEELAEIATC